MYNLAPMLSGTLYAAAGALLLAAPLGIASALFIAYYASPACGKLSTGAWSSCWRVFLPWSTVSGA